MRMHGAWHLYRPGERWQRPASAARVVLETARFVAVCFSAPVVELHTEESLARHPPLAELGPDILAPDFDAAEAARRLRAHEDLAIGEALLLQRKGPVLEEDRPSS
jgi:endonuclease-8